MKAYTRFNNEELFDMMQGLVPVDVTKGEDFNYWEQATDYIQWVLEQQDDIAVNIDLDCFIFDWSVVEDIASYMAEHGYTHCGFPDSGAMRGRNNASWVVCNPFFNIFQSAELLKDGIPNWAIVRHEGYRSEWHLDMPNFVKNPNPWMQEPFNGIFNWMHRTGKTLFLEPKQHADGTSTIMTWQGKEFGFHAWYSRQFNEDAMQRQRILSLYEESCRRQQS
jgi:hypothetical protein